MSPPRHCRFQSLQCVVTVLIKEDDGNAAQDGRNQTEHIQYNDSSSHITKAKKEGMTLLATLVIGSIVHRTGVGDGSVIGIFGTHHFYRFGILKFGWLVWLIWSFKRFCELSCVPPPSSN